MQTNIDFKKNSRTAAIVTALGALIMIIAFVIFLLISKRKSESLEARTMELKTKDSINEALYDTIKTLRPNFEPIAYAVPTGKMAHPAVAYMPKESPEFNYYICLNVTDSLKDKVLQVVYYFNDSTFLHKYRTSRNRLDSFKVGYRGWGCLDDLPIYIQRKDKSIDTINFKMCENLQLKGQSNAVH